MTRRGSHARNWCVDVDSSVDYGYKSAPQDALVCSLPPSRGTSNRASLTQTTFKARRRRSLPTTVRSSLVRGVYLVHGRGLLTLLHPPSIPRNRLAHLASSSWTISLHEQHPHQLTRSPPGPHRHPQSSVSVVSSNPNHGPQSHLHLRHHPLPQVDPRAAHAPVHPA